MTSWPHIGSPTSSSRSPSTCAPGGLGEGVDFYVAGRPVPGGLSSEYIGLRQLDDGSYRVWYLGDWGNERTFVETTEVSVARR